MSESETMNQDAKSKLHQLRVELAFVTDDFVSAKTPAARRNAEKRRSTILREIVVIQGAQLASNQS